MSVNPMIVVTVDTETDNLWARNDRRDCENIFALPRTLDPILQRWGVRATYLTTYPVASDSGSVRVLKALHAEGAEIGAHLHPWTTPPLVPLTDDDARHHPYPHELPLDLFHAKAARLTERLRDQFDLSPVSYRAGRWGFDTRSIGPLVELGYEVDTSVTPHVSWRDSRGIPHGPGGPDFTSAPEQPYFLSSEDVCRAGESSLLEVPVSISFVGPLAGMARRLDGSVSLGFMQQSLLSRVLRRAAGRLIWLRPHFHSLRDMICLTDRLAGQRAVCFNVMFHSSEMCLGTSPATRTAEELTAAMTRLDGILCHLVRNLQARSVTLAEFARGYAHRSAVTNPTGTAARRDTEGNS